MKTFKETNGGVVAAFVFIAIILATVLMSACSAPKTCAYMRHYNHDIAIGITH